MYLDLAIEQWQFPARDSGEEMQQLRRESFAVRMRVDYEDSATALLPTDTTLDVWRFSRCVPPC